MKQGICVSAMVLLMMFASSVVGQEAQPAGWSVFQPSLSVSGVGEVSVKPDRAVIRLGAVAQAKDAQAAQREVNQTLGKVLDAITAAGVAAPNITTAGLSLYPVYSDRAGSVREADQPIEPRIIGYRASNTVQVQVDDLNLVGTVIDAGVNAGANQLESLSFELKDDSRAREQALQQAAQKAQAKARTIAHAMGTNLGPILDIQEGGVNVAPPVPFVGRSAMAMAERSTPIEPGQIRVEATLTVRYGIKGN